MSQNQRSLFVSGLDLANLVVSSNLLHLSWESIQTLYAQVIPNQQHQPSSFSLNQTIYRQPNCTILAFVTSPICTAYHLQQAGDLVSSATLTQENFHLFNFLCSKGNPSFSINRAAITLFHSYFDVLSRLFVQLLEKDPMTNESLVDTPLIITGHSLGGSIASLFTICLLYNMDQRSNKRPLCITFGSPLIGDKGFQRAISEFSKWNSCFIHVAANRDPIPRLFISSHNAQPFGTFLLCSDSELGCTCVEDPEVVSKLLVAMGLEITRNQVPNEELTIEDYGRMIHHLGSRLFVKGSSQLGASDTHSLKSGIILQLEAIGIKRTQQHTVNIDDLIQDLERRELICLFNRRNMNAYRKLNDIKIRMAYLEWYKKVKAKNIGYYDSYKNQQSSEDIDIIKHKKFLSNYWEGLVEEAEKKPQKEGLNMRTMWLFAGTNYRRMIEPLDIAEYYGEKGKRAYEKERDKGRYRHYFLLEQWAKEFNADTPASNPSKKKKENVAAFLTEDSCFWSKVEEALISCHLWNDATSSDGERESAKDNLIKFEGYVMQQVKNYAVSPEIFLGGSSFMKWWEMFRQIIGTAYYSELVHFMKNEWYINYAIGNF